MDSKQFFELTSTPQFAQERWYATSRQGADYRVKVRLTGRRSQGPMRVWTTYLRPAMAPGSHWVRLEEAAPGYPELQVGDEFVVAPDYQGYMRWNVRTPGPVRRSF